jgi:23S rRNA (cytosine1962-C5)-methyltransferase
MVTIKLRKHHDKRLRRGHLWVFSNEIEHVEGDAEPGVLCRVEDAFGKFVGTGFYNPSSLIAVRLLGEEEIIADQAFFEQRIGRAVALRRQWRSDATALRLVHGESDGLPGLLVDRIGEVVSVQVVSAGMEARLDDIIQAIKQIVSPAYILLRNDLGLRDLEGLPRYEKVAHGGPEVPVQEITEHGVRYRVDVLHGQKTGFFIDQHENRKTFRSCVGEGDRVLDAFCNDGGFAFQAVLAGAGEVLGVDISESALERAAENARLNQMTDRVAFLKADLMKWLPQQAETERFNVINLDPPGFAKNRKTASAALKGYQKIHEAALRMLESGGYMATSTCSHHIDTQRFVETVTDAARRTGRKVVMVHRGSQPADHPVLPAMPETEYLRFFIFRCL